MPRIMSSADSRKQHAETFRKTVRPFLNDNCVFCHNKTLKTADLQLDAIRTPKAALKGGEIWEKVREKLLRGEMPPEGRPRPDPETVTAVLEWIESSPNRPSRDPRPDPGRVTARRLNRAEYNNTVRDLAGVDLRPADDFPADDAGYGFDNIGDVLSLPPVLMEKYMAAADKIARAAIVTPLRVKPTLEKFLAPRESGGRVGVTADGSFEVMHRFPVEAKYEIRIRVVDRRYRPKKDEPPPPLPPPARMAASLDGQQVKTFDVAADKYEQGTYDFRLEVPAGEHRLSAEFLSQGLEGMPRIEDTKDPYKGERKLFVDNFVILGPRNVKPPVLTDSHKRIMICGEAEGSYQPECAREILSNLAQRAYRRPLRDGEVDSLLGLVKLADKEGDTFAQGIQLALKAILVSPHFLFRIERDPDLDNPDARHEIHPHELATRLSYFLWSSMPDEELFQAAEEGTLRDPRKLGSQIRRMLEDPKSIALVENFAGQWLQLRNLESASPDPDRFPEFDEELRTAMRRETELFFESIMREDRSIVDFLNARFTFLNERLARHYGIEGVIGDEFRRIALEDERRGGVLTQASVLTVSSYPTRTSPVIRGKWLLENILGAPPPDPPPRAPPLDEAKVGLNGTLREQLEQHRANPTCAVCHARIDPLGFALENYDAIGAWRTHYGKFPIDASGTLPGGKSFSGPGELRAILTAKKRDFARCLTEKMLIYALGRGLEGYDKPTVEAIVRRLESDEFRFSRLVVEIANSMPFRMRRGEGWTQ
ncbi:MAG: DUF1592 domain-containing protein [Acidobacteriota bacterium]